MPRPTTVTVSSAAKSAWIPINQYTRDFGVAIATVIHSGATLTYDIEHTLDPIFQTRLAKSATNSTTTATLILTDHGLSAGDSIIVTGAGLAPYNGTFDVASVVDADTITYTMASDPGGDAGGNIRVVPLRVIKHDTVVGQTTTQDTNYQFPPQAVRINVTAYTDGAVDLIVNQVT